MSLNWAVLSVELVDLICVTHVSAVAKRLMNPTPLEKATGVERINIFHFQFSIIQTPKSWMSPLRSWYRCLRVASSERQRACSNAVFLINQYPFFFNAHWEVSVSRQQNYSNKQKEIWRPQIGLYIRYIVTNFVILSGSPHFLSLHYHSQIKALNAQKLKKKKLANYQCKNVIRKIATQ